MTNVNISPRPVGEGLGDASSRHTIAEADPGFRRDDASGVRDCRTRFYTEGLSVGDIGGEHTGFALTHPTYALTLFSAGERNGFIYPPEVLRQAAPLWQGVTSFIDHVRLNGERPEHPSVRDLAGVITRAWFDELTASVVGELQLTPSANCEWLARLLDYLVRERAAGRTVPNIGTSADMLFEHHAKRVTKIIRVLSHDIVFDPAAGGYLQRVIFSTAHFANRVGRTEQPQGGQMFRQFFSNVLDGAGGGGTGTVTVPSTSREGQGHPAPTDPNGLSVADGLGLADQSRAVLRAQCASLLDASLTNATDLPQAFRDSVRERFQETIFTPQELTAAIAQARTLYAAAIEPMVVQGMSARASDPARRGTGVSLWSDLDRLQFAIDRMFGVTLPDQVKDTPRLRGIQELYLLLSGDREFRGIYYPERVQFANATTSTMAALVANAMNKVIAAQWEKLGRAGYLWWKKIVHEDDLETLNDVRWITVGGFGDLPTVAEGAAYTEIVWDDNTETASFVKKGGYIGLTLEMLDRDQTNKVKGIPIGLATAQLRTLSNAIATLFTTGSHAGPTLADGTAWFHSTSALRGGDGSTAASGNLGTTALAAAEWDVAVQKIFKATELNSGKRLGLRPRYVVIPIDLEKTALQIFVSDTEPASNVYYENVRRSAAENVVVVPEWTDTNNWAAITDPDVYPCVGVGYRYGRTPEVFVSDQDAIGSMFTNTRSQSAISRLTTRMITMLS